MISSRKFFWVLFTTTRPKWVVCKISRILANNFLPRCNYTQFLMLIGPCIIVIVEEWKTNLISLAILFHFLCAQHVSDINISIIRSLQLCCWITTSVVLFSVRCVLEIWCGWFWVVFVLQAEARAQAINPQPPHTTWTEQLCFSLQKSILLQMYF